LIDAAFSALPSLGPKEARVAFILIPDTGEYARALRRLSSGPEGAGAAAMPTVPDEAYLHLFAYELLERMRERLKGAGGPPETFVLPLWPEAVFGAAGCGLSGVREIQGMYPSVPMKYYVRRPREAVEREARRVLGSRRIDAAAYLAAMEEAAGSAGWRIL